MQYDPIAEFISNLLQLAAHSTLSAYDQTPVQPLPLSTSHARNPISPFQLEQKDESRGFSGKVITSSLTEEQERRMDGHPWPTATPCCKTLSSHGAHAREFTCTITLLLLYTRSIYRFGGLAAPMSRGDVCVCACACALPCGHLLPSTPGGVVLGLVPLCLGNRLSNDKPPRSEGRRCFLAEEDQPRGIRAGFRCPLSFLLLG